VPGVPSPWGKYLVTPGGLRVEEESGPDQSIARLGCARTAFVGRTLRGPVDQPVLLSSFAEFQRVFGGLWQPSPLGYAVEQFFDNGGRAALVVRVVNGARAATLTLKAGSEAVTLRAVRPGTREFLRASVDYDNVPPANTAEFNLLVQRVRVQGTGQIEDQEIYPCLSMLPESERYVNAVLARSELVEVAGTLPGERPDQTVEPASGLATGYVGSNSDGDDGAPLSDYDVIGSEVDRTGMFALDNGDYFNLLCLPPLSRERDVGLTALLVAARFCRQRRALLMVDPPSDWHTAEDAVRGMREWGFCSENAVIYFPRVLALDKLRGHFESFAPCGAIAGMLARSDESFPVWGPPKIAESILRQGYRPSCLVPEDKRVRLAALGVNVVQAVRTAARFGVEPRTMAGGSAGAADWQRLTARRLALFILNSIERGTRWVIFARSRGDATELATVQLHDFFLSLHAAGAFGERSLEESYFVICDRRVNSAGESGAHAFQFVVGFAAERRGEFHSYRIAHSAAGSKVSPVSLNRLTMIGYSPAELEWVDAFADELVI
jgi:phage tail sheath protein FI